MEEEEEARAPACGWEKLCQECKPSAGRCAGAAGGPDASLDTRREGWPGTAAAGRHEARRRNPGVSASSSLGTGPPLQRSSSLNETLR